MKKVKLQIKQTTVFTVCCAATVVIVCCMGLMFGIWGREISSVADIQDEYAVETQEEQDGIKPTGLKYTLQNPEEKIEENITSVVTEETDVQKSSRLEDIMGVLSEETGVEE